MSVTNSTIVLIADTQASILSNLQTNCQALSTDTNRLIRHQPNGTFKASVDLIVGTTTITNSVPFFSNSSGDITFDPTFTYASNSGTLNVKNVTAGKFATVGDNAQITADGNATFEGTVEVINLIADVGVQTSTLTSPTYNVAVEPVLNFVPQAQPGTATAGDTYYDSTLNETLQYNGLAWIPIGAAPVPVVNTITDVWYPYPCSSNPFTPDSMMSNFLRVGDTFLWMKADSGGRYSQHIYQWSNYGGGWRDITPDTSIQQTVYIQNRGRTATWTPPPGGIINTNVTVDDLTAVSSLSDGDYANTGYGVASQDGTTQVQPGYIYTVSSGSFTANYQPNPGTGITDVNNTVWQSTGTGWFPVEWAISANKEKFIPLVNTFASATGYTYMVQDGFDFTSGMPGDTNNYIATVTGDTEGLMVLAGNIYTYNGESMSLVYAPVNNNVVWVQGSTVLRSTYYIYRTDRWFVFEPMDPNILYGGAVDASAGDNPVAMYPIDTIFYPTIWQQFYTIISTISGNPNAATGFPTYDTYDTLLTFGFIYGKNNGCGDSFTSEIQPALGAYAIVGRVAPGSNNVIGQLMYYNGFGWQTINE
jgi:hypothetical protein